MKWYDPSKILADNKTVYFVNVGCRNVGKMYRQYELFGLYLKIIYDHMMNGENPDANEESEVNTYLSFLITSREKFRSL